MSEDLKTIAAMIDQGTTNPDMGKATGKDNPNNGATTGLSNDEPSADELDNDLPDDDLDDDLGVDTGDDAGDNEPTVKTIAQLAEAIDVDPEFLYNIEIGMPEGEAPIPLGKLKDQYQQVTKQNKQMEQALAQQQQQLIEAQNGMGQAQQVSQEVQTARDQVNAINAQFNSIDWEKAKTEDPGATALARQEFQEAFAAANSQLQRAEAYQQQMSQQMSHAQLVQAAQKTLQLIPEWSNEEVRQKDEVAIQQALHHAGYSQQEIASARDPIAISLMRELVMLREEKAAGTKAVERVRNAPKVLGGGQQRGRMGFQKQTQHLVEKAKSTGRSEDQLQAAKAILAGAGRR